MRPLRFCQSCGTELVEGGHDGGMTCPSCGRVWYRNMAPTVGAAIVRDGRALATVRAMDPMPGKLDVPGGFLGPMEPPLEGLKREIGEELSIEIEATMDDHDWSGRCG